MVEVKEGPKIKGIGKFFYVQDNRYPKGSFYDVLNLLKSLRLDPVSARDLAYARIANGKDEFFDWHSYIREGFIYLEKKVLCIRDGPLLDLGLAKKATQLAAEEKKCYFRKERIDKYINMARQDKDKDIYERRVLILDKKDSNTYPSGIPLSELKENKMALWFFGDQTKKYSDFLGKNRSSHWSAFLGKGPKNSIYQAEISDFKGNSSFLSEGHLTGPSHMLGILREVI